MYNCVKCGVLHDYTDGFAVLKPDGTTGSACWTCFEAMGCPKFVREPAPSPEPAKPETWRTRPPLI